MVVAERCTGEDEPDIPPNVYELAHHIFPFERAKAHEWVDLLTKLCRIDEARPAVRQLPPR
jgi:hypothetical protein